MSTQQISTSNQVNKLEVDELTLIVEATALQTTVRWQGVSESPDPEKIVGPFLGDLIAQIDKRKFVMDFTALEYMNSATLQPLLRVLRKLNEHEIETEVIYNPELEWQRINFRSIRTVTLALPHINILSSQELA